jgi:hypothetical protein
VENAVLHVAAFLMSVIAPVIWSNGPIQGADSDAGGRHRWQDTGGTDAALQGNAIR